MEAGKKSRSLFISELGWSGLKKIRGSWQVESGRAERQGRPGEKCNPWLRAEKDPGWGQIHRHKTGQGSRCVTRESWPVFSACFKKMDYTEEEVQKHWSQKDLSSNPDHVVCQLGTLGKSFNFSECHRYKKGMIMLTDGLWECQLRHSL